MQVTKDDWQEVKDGLHEIQFTVKENAKEVKRWADHTKEQNGRIGTLEHRSIEHMAAQAERVKWEERQWGFLKFLIPTTLTIAGILSGIIFGIAQVVLTGGLV